MIDYNNIFPFDIETSVKNKTVGKFGGNPFCHKNNIVLFGCHHGPVQSTGDVITTDIPESIANHLAKAIRNDAIFVGQNIKFDLLYLFRFHEFRKVLPYIKVWDCQLAEYLITGQRNKMWSMDKMAEKYHGTLKNDIIKQYWKDGKDTEDIPPHELDEYLRDDVMNTYIPYRAQVRKMLDLGMENLMWSQMRFLKATCEMEWNGMHVNLAGMDAKRKELQFLCDIEENTLLQFMKNRGIPEPKASKTAQISRAFFGGDIEVFGTELMVDANDEYLRYKTGKKKGELKRRKWAGMSCIPGIIAPQTGVVRNKKGDYPIDEEHLQRIADASKDKDLKLVIASLLEYRSLSKDISTYYEGYAALTWPDSKIHANLKHCNTHTGRLSCSKPNLQNLTRKD